MYIAPSSVKQALSSAGTDINSITVGTDKQRQRITNYTSLEQDIDRTILDAAKKPSKEYVTAKVNALNSDVSKTIPTTIQNGNTENLFIFRSHVTHPIQSAGGQLLSDMSITYGDKENTYSTLEWKIERFQRIEWIPQQSGGGGGSTTPHWALITNASNSGMWLSNYSPHGHTESFPGTVESSSDITDAKISELGFEFTAAGMELSAAGWLFGLQWIHATPNPLEIGTNNFYNPQANQGVRFLKAQVQRAIDGSDAIGGWYNKQTTFKETYAPDT
jgi:hypothetical protein